MIRQRAASVAEKHRRVGMGQFSRRAGGIRRGLYLRRFHRSLGYSAGGVVREV